MEDWLFIERVKEVLNNCDSGKITDSQGIKKLMKSMTKYIQSKYKKGEVE
jgi:hypothetical protein